jgi:hypothetical protein
VFEINPSNSRLQRPGRRGNLYRRWCRRAELGVRGSEQLDVVMLWYKGDDKRHTR